MCRSRHDNVLFCINFDFNIRYSGTFFYESYRKNGDYTDKSSMFTGDNEIL